LLLPEPVFHGAHNKARIFGFTDLRCCTQRKGLVCGGRRTCLCRGYWDAQGGNGSRSSAKSTHQLQYLVQRGRGLGGGLSTSAPCFASSFAIAVPSPCLPSVTILSCPRGGGAVSIPFLGVGSCWRWMLIS
jgi:hypothetical protein